ncbi:YqhR family membrane protein [Aquibacillus salsiterrae]|uniref:YqhR family membrane protein n=1 Tax=Aquibacillus salsiterrae TaxID=2950439 RepID=A0A9X3WAW0_9BACI|nr:YqhR family membrane protein [Aquibacillus salsiterrae]MDC3415497.1 YqhR family membrane protein [Aquibacillus salsiterrae]
MEKDKSLEQNQRAKPTSLIGNTIITGLVGGLLWSFFGFLSSFFNFSKVSPASFILRPWLVTGWSDGFLGQLISIVVIGILSIAIAIIYYLLFKHLKGIWPSAVFGIALWFIVFYLLQPIFPNIPHMTKLDSDTVVTTICLYLLYGTFIGYSISYAYLDKKRMKIYNFRSIKSKN